MSAPPLERKHWILCRFLLNFRWSKLLFQACFIRRGASGVVSLAALLCGCGENQTADAPPERASASSQRRTRLEKSRFESASTSPDQLVNATLPHQQQRETALRSYQPDDWFEDVTAKSGVAFAYRDGSEAGFYELIESIGGGVVFFDYNADSRLDIFLMGGGAIVGPPVEIKGRSCALFRNDGNWSFSDVTEEAGLTDSSLYTHGATAVDLDADGFPDLFIAGYGGVKLLHNQQDGTFQDATAPSGLVSPIWNVTSAWGDIDRDGLADLYLVTYADAPPDHRRRCPNDQQLRDVCGPTAFEGVRDSMWRNLGDGTFQNVTENAGLQSLHRGLGAVAADINEDEWVDFFVVNDVNENELYLGGPDITFREVGELAGVAFSATGEREGSMGVDLGDFNGDGAPDLFYANFSQQDNTLLRRVSPDGFLNVTSVTGLAGRSRKWVGFGTGFADFDSDGWLDLFVANGHVNYERRDAPYFQPAQLFRNIEGQRYVEVSEKGGAYFELPHAGRGAAVGDLDNDGAEDLVISHQNDPVALLRNRLPVPHWVRVELVGTASNRDAIGAKVTVTHGDRTLTRWVHSGGGYLSHFDSRVLFPLRDEAPANVTIHWPSGLTEDFEGLEPQKDHILVEGKGRPASEELSEAEQPRRF